MRLVAIVLILSGLSLALPARAASPLQELLEKVREESSQERMDLQERLRRFEAEKDKQAALLEEARKELEREEARTSDLKQRFETNQESLKFQLSVLQRNLGDLGRLKGISRELAASVRGTLANSLITAQYPDRLRVPELLSKLREMPSIAQLTDLWLLQLQEIAESGRVVRFGTKVITSRGEVAQARVTRVGVFTVTSDGNFLRYLPETRDLVEPPRQPPLRYRRLAQELEQASEGLVTTTIDPTRGSMLALLVQTPDLRERLEQGGIIGYIILGLGALGLLLVLERFLRLGWLWRAIRRQLQDETPNPLNPLGRIMQVYAENPGLDAETLGLKLDEAILRELPVVQRGLGTLSILAAVAPLLGLLGTVTGIIETFQSITLFGTGDPRVMSGGISQALVTTVEGLAVAIPLLLFHSMLSTRSQRIVQVLDEESAAMVARMAEQAGRHA
ncbi:MAG: MotA/TolQ/ExbB proton channel family protein [Gammaproteobacteria bacterium]|nr:MAG: MotA/TolQ/ExbB proton channel family protein [Gammaproteobacteria bacterium]